MSKNLKRIRLFCLLKLKEMIIVGSVFGLLCIIFSLIGGFFNFILTKMSLVDFFLSLFTGLLILSIIVGVSLGLCAWFNWNWQEVKRRIP